MSPNPNDLTFLTPADLPGPSGGSNYNDAMLRHLLAAGHRVRAARVPGDWPRPTGTQRDALAAAMAGSRTVLVDGIMALACPTEIRVARDAGTAVHILLHSFPSIEAELQGGTAHELAALERATLQEATSVICTSHWATRDVRARPHAGPIRVVVPGTDRAATARGSSPPQLLILAALTPLKNQMLALHALARNTDMPWTARLVGSASRDPRYARMLRRHAERTFDPGRVEICGTRTGEELEEIWNRTDLLLLPSRHETYGMVVTEALARAIPAIVSAGTGAVEALLGAEEPERGPPGQPPGAVVEADTLTELATILRDWFLDQNLRSRWRASALLRRDRLRTWHEAAGELQRILDGGPAGSTGQ